MEKIASKAYEKQLSPLLKELFEQDSIYWGGGGGGEGRDASPQEVFPVKKLKAISNTNLICRRYQGISEGYLCPEMRFQPILNTIFSKFSRGSMPPVPPRRPKNFSRRCLAPKVFKDRFPQNKKS